VQGYLAGTGGELHANCSRCGMAAALRRSAWRCSPTPN
jgi:hypothetical protein